MAESRRKRREPPYGRNMTTDTIRTSRPTKKQRNQTHHAKRLPAKTEVKERKDVPIYVFRDTYSNAPKLRNGNGSKYDPIAEDAKHGKGRS